VFHRGTLRARERTGEAFTAGRARPWGIAALQAKEGEDEPCLAELGVAFERRMERSGGGLEVQ
jgi:hypothetical protein